MTARKDNIWKNILFIALTIVFSIFSAFVTVSYERGDINARVSGLEESNKELKDKDILLDKKFSVDHDLLIQVDTKLDGVKEAVTDIGKKLDRLNGIRSSAGKK